MYIQDVIRAIRKATGQISVVFYDLYYKQCPITVRVYNKNVTEELEWLNEVIIQRKRVIKAGLNPVLDGADMSALSNAVNESCQPITLVFIGFAILEFDVNVFSNLITSGRHPIILIFADADLGYDNVTTIVTSIKEAQRPVTLIFEDSKISEAGTIILAEAMQESRVPVTLKFHYSFVDVEGLFVEAIKKAQAPVNVIFDDTNEPESKLYADAMHDNFVIDARINPSKFFKRIGFSMVRLMLNQTLSFYPNELIGLIKSYISDADLAWVEVLAIRSVEDASYENKYSSINKVALMSRYFPHNQVDYKGRSLKEEVKPSLLRPINSDATLCNILLLFLAQLCSNPKVTSAMTLPYEFAGRETLIKFLTLVSSKPIEAPMAVPAGFIDVPGDGLCFYHAVAQQLGNENGLNLQQRAINEILVHHERYQGFLDDRFWDDNLKYPGKDNRGWAGHVMIQAVANLLHRPIEIRRFGLDGIENQDKVMIQPDDLEHSALKLGNIANLHFVAANDTQVSRHNERRDGTVSDYAATYSSVAINQEPLKLSGENSENI